MERVHATFGVSAANRRVFQTAVQACRENLSSLGDYTLLVCMYVKYIHNLAKLACVRNGIREKKRIYIIIEVHIYYILTPLLSARMAHKACSNIRNLVHINVDCCESWSRSVE